MREHRFISDELQEIFKTYDTDNSGTMSSHEMRDALAAAGSLIQRHAMQLYHVVYDPESIQCLIKQNMLKNQFWDTTENRLFNSLVPLAQKWAFCRGIRILTQPVTWCKGSRWTALFCKSSCHATLTQSTASTSTALWPAWSDWRCSLVSLPILIYPPCSTEPGFSTSGPQGGRQAGKRYSFHNGLLRLKLMWLQPV